jgi:tRNA uracil 4-sulfurtransferase
VFFILILVHYGELALKGKNRRLFESKLIENIKKVGGKRFRRLEGRLVVIGGDINYLKNVFGIHSFAPAYKVEKDLEAIKELVLEKIGEKVKERPTFGVFVKRADKSFPYKSLEVANTIGEEVIKKYSLKVRLREPELPIYIEIANEAFVYFQKISGLGGLPVGISGKVLTLLSGGIDSPVASYLMMKRGCQVDFIHFHAFPNNKAVFQTKVEELVQSLCKYGFESRVLLAPYHPFQLALLERGVSPGYEIVLFRRFMIKVAEKAAGNWGYKALVTGDSLGQVASQTIDNLKVLSEAISLPIFQPLISFDKQEIIDIAKKIGTYEVSIKPYKDCCSIVAPNPKTKTRLEIINAMEKKLYIERVVNETVDLIESYQL